MGNVQKLHIKKTPLQKIRNIFIVIIIICILLYILLISCKIENISIEGLTHYTENELKDKVINGYFDNYSILLYLKYKYMQTYNIPYIEDIKIELLDKNSVNIVVYEKGIIGYIKYMGEYIYFDKDGIIVETSVNKIKEVPYISGISFSNITLHEKMNVANEELFKIILNITQAIRKDERKLYLYIERVDFDINYNVTLYTDKLKILLGKRDVYDEQIEELNKFLPLAIQENREGVLHMENYEEGAKIRLTKE